MDRTHGFPADVDDSQVDEMLAICSDESLLKLSLNSHSTSSSLDSLLLDSDLLSRFHKLKSSPPSLLPPSQPSPPLSDRHDIDILGAHLASRLAALKQPSFPSPGHLQPTAPTPPAEKRPPSSANRGPALSSTSGRNQEMPSVSSSDAREVEKLLASVSDRVRSGKTRLSDEDAADGAKDWREEISDSEVEEILEWAKDAARLDICDDDGGPAEPALGEEAQQESTPSPRSLSKKTGIGWKFW